MTYNDKCWSYQISVEIPLAECIANFLPNDLVLQHFIQMLNARLKVFNELLRHPLDSRLCNENVYDTYFDWHSRRRKKIEVAIMILKLGLPPCPFLRVRLRVAGGWMTYLEDRRCLMTWNVSSFSSSDDKPRVTHSNSLEIGGSTVGIVSSGLLLAIVLQIYLRSLHLWDLRYSCVLQSYVHVDDVQTSHVERHSSPAALVCYGTVTLEILEVVFTARLRCFKGGSSMSHVAFLFICAGGLYTTLD